MRNFGRLLLIACIAAVALWALRLRTEAPAPRAEPRGGGLNDPSPYAAVAPGLTEPKGEEHKIGSEVIGTLKEVDIEENDHVRKGQVIAVVKNDDLKAALEEAKAQEKLTQADLRKAQIDYRRFSALQKADAASTATLDRARRNLDVSEAECEKAAAAVSQVRAQLDKTYIRSPINGTVLKKMVVAGAAVSNQPPTPIAIVGDLCSLRVRAEVDELDIGKIHKGQQVLIKADAYPGLSIKGKVIRVDKRMGARRIQTDRSTERVDSKVLQTLIELDKGANLPVNLRVDVYFLPSSHKSSR